MFDPFAGVASAGVASALYGRRFIGCEVIKEYVEIGRDRLLEHPRLDLIPADFSYRRMDVQLNKRHDATTLLLKLMRPLRQRYACLVLDCPPGMSLVSENVMHAADALGHRTPWPPQYLRAAHRDTPSR